MQKMQIKDLKNPLKVGFNSPQYLSHTTLAIIISYYFVNLNLVIILRNGYSIIYFNKRKIASYI